MTCITELISNFHAAIPYKTQNHFQQFQATVWLFLPQSISNCNGYLHKIATVTNLTWKTTVWTHSRYFMLVQIVLIYSYLQLYYMHPIHCKNSLFFLKKLPIFQLHSACLSSTDQLFINFTMLTKVVNNTEYQFSDCSIIETQTYSATTTLWKSSYKRGTHRRETCPDTKKCLNE